MAQLLGLRNIVDAQFAGSETEWSLTGLLQYKSNVFKSGASFGTGLLAIVGMPARYKKEKQSVKGFLNNDKNEEHFTTTGSLLASCPGLFPN
ncbi:MAG: hypothetical protein R3D58_01825 [Saprospiraceae bacterium]|nr:hypothetical protein [Lewinellaceae bacterium]